MGRAGMIAIVDDDGSVRSAISDLLRSFGYDAITFESAGRVLAFKHCAGRFLALSPM